MFAKAYSVKALFQARRSCWNFASSWSWFTKSFWICANFVSKAAITFDVDTKGKDFPAQPERDFEQIHRHSYNEMVQEITNALSILRMTDEETVNASTMKSIAKYL